MKKIISIIALITTLTNYSQDLKLTPEGFESKVGKKFLVIKVDSTSKEKIYQKTLVYLNTLYKSPKDVISKVENETITVNGYTPNSIKRNGMGHVFDMNYTIVFRFKENKLRIDAPTFDLTAFNGKKQTLHLVWTKMNLTGSNLGIFGKRNKLKSKRAKEGLENYFNGYINLLKNSVLEKNKEDW